MSTLTLDDVETTALIPLMNRAAETQQKILPASPFANGLDKFCMNGGMIVRPVYLCIAVPHTNKK